jgi:hypothetical protein
MTGCHLFDANDVKPQTHQTIRDFLKWSILWEVMYDSFDGFFAFWLIGEVCKAVTL